jgi:PPM family protein phosphatase
MSSPDTANDTDTPRKPRDDELDVYGLTHVGKVRKTNQDHFLICSLKKQIEIHNTSLDVDQLQMEGDRMAFLAMVADGVGGGTKGETASRIALETVTRYVTMSMRAYHEIDSSDDQAFLDALQEAAWQCHASVVAEAEADPDRRGMATTLTMWIGVWPRAYLLQVGDSRFYIFRDDKLTQISRDQTMAQELVDQGVLTMSGAFNTRWANVLSSSIGGQQTAPLVTRMDQDWNNIAVLCSDGLTKHVTDEQIADRLRSWTTAKEVCETLLQDALDAGGTDNITVIAGRDIRKD